MPVSVKVAAPLEALVLMIFSLKHFTQPIDSWSARCALKSGYSMLKRLPLMLGLAPGDEQQSFSG